MPANKREGRPSPGGGYIAARLEAVERKLKGFEELQHRVAAIEKVLGDLIRDGERKSPPRKTPRKKER